MKHNPGFNPAVVDAECFCLNVRRAARAISRRYDELLRPLDLNNGQFSTLVVVAGLQPAAMQTLAERLGLDRTTLTAHVQPLHRRGLLEIAVDPSDRRGRHVSLTSEGRELVQRAMPIWTKLQREFAARFEGRGAEHFRTEIKNFV